MEKAITKEEVQTLALQLKTISTQHNELINIIIEVLEKLSGENTELQDQLDRYQSPDYQSLDVLINDLRSTFCAKYFTNGDRVRLKHQPGITGTIKGFKVVWLMGGIAAAHDVLFDHHEEVTPVITYALEPLPEADDPEHQKQ
ncbi:TPA: hypothetical protein I8Y21_004575 [Klebsiella oxytoca]|uniref:Uncharacterized protein n=1 Tax=Klebsiella oxytoca TaxID=571 RepID=A0AAN5LBT1_KLEOX|nr:hypothetical protein [Klebsiella oxytoca]